MKKNLKIAVYCSSRDGLPEEDEAVARATGEWIGRNGHTLVYGGVNAGLMHTVAQATHDAGGRVVGVIPERFAHRGDAVVDEMIATRDLSDRKMKMIEMSDLFVVLPGGIGTLDEWLSTLSQIMVNGEDDRRGIVAVNMHGLYDAQAQELVQVSKSIFARGKHIDMTAMANNTEQLIEYLTKYQENYEK